MRKIIVNAATSLTGDTAKDFFDFLTEQKHLGISYFKKNDNISFKENTISLQQDVFCADLEPDGSYHLNFMGPKLDEGGFAIVYPIDKTIKVTHINFVEFGYAQPQVVKVQLHCSCNDDVERTGCIKHNPKKSLQNEIHLSQKVPHLKCQQPVLHLEKTSFTVMNRLPGTDLFSFLKRVELDGSLLNLQQRMGLSLAILRALKTQVTDQGIIHRDIKPENILVGQKALVDQEAAFNVGIIDYGYAVEMLDGESGIYNPDCNGSLAYIAPEILSSEKKDNGFLQTPAIDLFSTARTLILVWGGLDESYSYTDPYFYWIYLHTSNFKQISSLFNNIPKADHELLKTLGLDLKIQSFLKPLLSLNPQYRGNIDTAIGLFEAIHREFAQKTSPSITSVSSTMFSAIKPQPQSTHRQIRKSYSYTEGSTSSKMLFFLNASKISPRKCLSPISEEHETHVSAKRRQEAIYSDLSIV